MGSEPRPGTCRGPGTAAQPSARSGDASHQTQSGHSPVSEAPGGGVDSLESRRLLEKSQHLTIPSISCTHVVLSSLQRTLQGTLTLCSEFHKHLMKERRETALKGLGLHPCPCACPLPVSLRSLPPGGRADFLCACDWLWDRVQPFRGLAWSHLSRWASAQALLVTPERGSGMRRAQLSRPGVSDPQRNPCLMKGKNCHCK